MIWYSAMLIHKHKRRKIPNSSRPTDRELERKEGGRRGEVPNTFRNDCGMSVRWLSGAEAKLRWRWPCVFLPCPLSLREDAVLLYSALSCLHFIHICLQAFKSLNNECTPRLWQSKSWSLKAKEEVKRQKVSRDRNVDSLLSERRFKLPQIHFDSCNTSTAAAVSILWSCEFRWLEGEAKIQSRIS